VSTSPSASSHVSLASQTPIPSLTNTPLISLSASSSSSTSSVPSLLIISFSSSASGSSTASVSRSSSTTVTATLFQIWNATSSSVATERDGALFSDLENTTTLIYATSILSTLVLSAVIIVIFVMRARRKRTLERLAVDSSIFTKVNPMHAAGLLPTGSSSIVVAAVSSSSMTGTVLEFEGLGRLFEMEGLPCDSKEEIHEDRIFTNASFQRHQFGTRQSFERGYLSESIKAWETKNENN